MGSTFFLLELPGFDEHLGNHYFELLRHDIDVDMTIVIDDSYIKVHRFVLTEYSSYFREKFAAIPAEQDVVAVLDDVSKFIISDLILYMYHGRALVEESDLDNFVSTAERLAIQGLTYAGQDPHLDDPVRFYFTNIEDLIQLASTIRPIHDGESSEVSDDSSTLQGTQSRHELSRSNSDSRWNGNGSNVGRDSASYNEGGSSLPRTKSCPDVFSCTGHENNNDEGNSLQRSKSWSDVNKETGEGVFEVSRTQSATDSYEDDNDYNAYEDGMSLARSKSWPDIHKEIDEGTIGMTRCKSQIVLSVVSTEEFGNADLAYDEDDYDYIVYEDGMSLPRTKSCPAINKKIDEGTTELTRSKSQIVLSVMSTEEFGNADLASDEDGYDEDGMSLPRSKSCPAINREVDEGTIGMTRCKSQILLSAEEIDNAALSSDEDDYDYNDYEDGMSLPTTKSCPDIRKELDEEAIELTRSKSQTLFSVMSCDDEEES